MKQQNSSVESLIHSNKIQMENQQKSDLLIQQPMTNAISKET